MPLRRSWRPALSVAIAIAGFATAMLVGSAMAKSFTLKVKKGATVTDQAGHMKTETIVTWHGSAVYLLTGDSQHHPQCTSATCLQAWRPVTVSSAKKLSKAPGINPKLGIWKHKGMNQVTLGGHPLYGYYADSANGNASGEGVRNFGGVWHVIKASAGRSSGPGGTTSTRTSTSTSSTTTTSQWG